VRATAPPAVVYRLGRLPDPWAWPDWAYADADGTFGNRYDDPRGIYRVLYASTQRVGTFVECLAYFRPDLEAVAGMQAIAAEEGDEEPPAAGVAPAEWTEGRCVGRAELIGEYADVGHHESLAELRLAFAASAVQLGLNDLNAAAIRLNAPRSFTQAISRHVFDQTEGGQRRWNGLSYLSKHGDDLRNWAVFEPASPTAVDIDPLNLGDPDLQAALALHGLTIQVMRP
jgi:hypothetical protein